MVTAVKGQATVKRPGRDVNVKAERGMAVQVGDVVITGPDGKCQVTLADDSFINLDVSSAVRVHQFSFDQRSSRRSAVVRVVEGTARVVVFKQRLEGSRFIVESPTASVDIGMLADLVVSVTPESSDIAVLDQSVTVENISPVYVGEFKLSQNMKTTVKKSGTPSQPAILTQDERTALLKRLRNW